MRHIPVRLVLVVGLRTVITLLFVPAIVAKLGQPAAWGHLFVTWGYPAWGAVAVSLVEIAGRVGVTVDRIAAVPSVRPLAALASGALHDYPPAFSDAR